MAYEDLLQTLHQYGQWINGATVRRGQRGQVFSITRLKNFANRNMLFVSGVGKLNRDLASFSMFWHVLAKRSVFLGC